jgi:hypothetical protein
MPYALIKQTDGSYAVKNKDTGRLMSKHTTKEKAEAQLRLLHMLMSKELGR